MAHSVTPRRIGPYRVLSAISQSPTTQIFQVDLPTSSKGERFALKTFLTMHFADRESAGRFKREIAISQGIKNPHVVNVHDWGYIDGTIPYMVLELLEGCTLQEMGRQPVPLALDMMRQLLVGLEAIHQAGVVHRDIRADNLFWHRNEVLKILDFGLARRFAGAALTPTGTTVGSVSYISPEQLFDSKHVDARSDLFSAGAVLYFLLTGRLPVTASSRAEALDQLSSGTWPNVLTLRSDIPLSVAQWLDRMMQVDRSRRPADARTARESLPRL